MRTKKQIEIEIVSLSGLGGIIETYKEIAATRITRTRTSVLKSHAFLDDINGVYEQVKMSYRRNLEAMAKKQKNRSPNTLSFIKNNGRTIHLFLSSNTGLYGDIVARTFSLFSENTLHADRRTTDIAVVGRLGLYQVQEAKYPPPYFYFDFPDQKVDEKALEQMALFLLQYEKIIVYYQEFKTLVKQIAVVSDISGNELEIKQTFQPKKAEQVKFLFEPSLEKVLEFFEKEIFASIFEQTIRDSQLAKFASRLITLDAASENIKKSLNSSVFENIRLRHREKNKKQSQTFSSMNLWK